MGGEGLEDGGEGVGDGGEGVGDGGEEVGLGLEKLLFVFLGELCMHVYVRFTRDIEIRVSVFR